MSNATQPAPALKRTPLFELHQEAGGRMVEFGGWEMPVQYRSILDEHRAVRQRAGLFDVSHMGEFRIEGSGALDFLQQLVPNDVSKLAINQILYTQLCLPTGGTVDDCTLYHLDTHEYLLVVNASTMEKDWEWVNQHAGTFDLTKLENASFEIALLALQGPQAQAVLQTIADINLADLAYYHCHNGTVAGVQALISRTGYTGEDGFELYHDATDAPHLWKAILGAGQSVDVLPIGLGARDTLRLEASMCLYGHELTEEITPLEAGLGWSVKLDKGVDFIGREALVRQKAEGLKRKRIGIEMIDRSICRAGYALLANGQQIGELTSGTVGPTIEKTIGMGYVPPDYAKPGTALEVDIRGKAMQARVVSMPFYKRQK